jgi:hypothetical protein
MILDPTDKYTKYFYNSYYDVDELLTKLYPDGIMDIVVYEGNLVDNFIGYGPFDFKEIDWDEKPDTTYDYVVILEKPTSSWSSGQEIYFTNDENWVEYIREEFEKDYKED